VTDPSACSRSSLQRARQALRCLPFRRAFYQLLEDGAISSVDLAARSDQASLCRRALSSSQVEDHFIWLIQLGVLRREVDGQGLTERVRLTPLGRDLLMGCPAEIVAAGRLERLRHWLLRHRPRF